MLYKRIFKKIKSNATWVVAYYLTHRALSYYDKTVKYADAREPDPRWCTIAGTVPFPLLLRETAGSRLQTRGRGDSALQLVCPGHFTLHRTP